MKNIKQNIEFLGLSYKKEMTRYIFLLALLMVVGVVLFYLLKTPYVLLGTLGAIMLFTFIYFYRYQGKKNELIANGEHELITLLSYFEVFVSNNMNVYNALESLIPYSSNYLRGLLERMLSEIDVDKTVQPFINFAHNFKNSIFESVMLSIYQMVDNGEKEESMTQFTLLFSNISENEKENKIKVKQSSLDSLNIYPLIGAAFVSILLIASTMSIMGDMVYVI